MNPIVFMGPEHPLVHAYRSGRGRSVSITLVESESSSCSGRWIRIGSAHVFQIAIVYNTPRAALRALKHVVQTRNDHVRSFL